MKKSKLSITLVTGFIAAMALSACSDVTSSKNALVTFTPYGSKEKISLLTNDVYDAYRDTSNGVSKFYDKILEVLIRYQFKEKGFDKGEMNYQEIEKWAANQVKEQQQKAKDAAKSNNTSYDKEWDSILESNDVENAKELKEKFIYEKEHEVMKNWYADDDSKAAELKEQFLGINASGEEVNSEVKAAMPYHIRHILVKVDEASDANEKFYKGTITEESVHRLYNIVTSLTAGGDTTFADVAKEYSEDGSASQGGDVGIVTNSATSGNLAMVNEFQLGLYAYDNLYDAANVADAEPAKAIKKGLGITAEVEAALPNDVVEIPYEVFINLEKYAKVTTDKEGNKLADGSTALYPRNIIWNKYLNLHNVFVIKNAKKADYSTLAEPKDEFASLVSGDVYDANLANFNNDKYLTDEKGNVIIGVRSQYGIHFMVIEESMYDYAELGTYYDTKLPTDPTYDKSVRSYVNYIESAKLEDYKKRADDVKGKITSFDSTYDYRLYSYLKEQTGEIKFTGAAEGLGKKIEQYITAQRDNNSYKQEDGLRQVWRTYTELLGAQQFNREAQYTTYNTYGASATLTRLVPEKIADDFFKLYENPAGQAATYAKFAEEGEYHYYA